MVTDSDDSNPEEGRYYKTSSNLPWALDIAGHFDYALERVAINSAYLQFNGWAESCGALYSDWYENHTGYRDGSKIYPKR